ncbi:MAG: choice-of-anchor Q domain-containing protein [Phycisphaerales bacterium]
MSTTHFRSVCLCGAAVFLSTGSASAAVIYVNAGAAPGGNGSSWATARNDLQAALSAAQSGDEVWVAQGVYKPHPTDRAVSFELKSGVAIYGGFTGVEDSLLQRSPANTSTLSGEINAGGSSDNSYHVVHASNVSASALLDGFLITSGQALGGAGFASGYGGGLYVDATLGLSPTLRGLTFSNNAALASGGALYCSGGSLSLERCFFFGNRISGSSGVGGAIGLGSIAGVDLTVANCVFAQNFTLAAAGGGAIYANGGALVNVISSTFYNNSAPVGSVLAGAPASATFSNCVFNGSGGASAYFAVPVIVRYSIVPGGLAGAGNVATAATFVNAPAANFRLASGSPGINVGSNAALEGLATDYDTNPRILQSVTDMGAYEFIERTCAGDLNKDGIVDDADFVSFASAYNNLTDRDGDLNADLLTDDADFVIFAGAYDQLLCP